MKQVQLLYSGGGLLAKHLNDITTTFSAITQWAVGQKQNPQIASAVKNTITAIQLVSKIAAVCRRLL